jgi:acyl-CoA thioester hydrolase
VLSANEHGAEFDHREHVRSEWIDYNGHMNVAYFVLVFDHATDAVLERLGVGESYREASGCSVFVGEMRVNYFHEVMCQEELHVRSRVLRTDARRAVIFHRMFSSKVDRVVASNEVICVHVDLSQRRSTPWSPAVAERLSAAISDGAPSAGP